MNIYTIGENILDEWHWVEPELALVLADHPSGYPMSDYLKQIQDMQQLVLVIEDGDTRCVSLLAIHPESLHVVAAAGKGLDTWGHVAEQALTYIAKGLGVKYITSNARKGWAKRQVQHNGWTEREVFIVRAV